MGRILTQTQSSCHLPPESSLPAPTTNLGETPSDTTDFGIFIQCFSFSAHPQGSPYVPLGSFQSPVRKHSYVSESFFCGFSVGKGVIFLGGRGAVFIPCAVVDYLLFALHWAQHPLSEAQRGWSLNGSVLYPQSPTLSSTFCGTFWVMGVLMNPGRTLLQRIPCLWKGECLLTPERTEH